MSSSRPLYDVSAYQPENHPAAVKMLAKRSDNSQRLNELERQGIALDLATARTEHFMRQLCDIGVFTEAQLIEFQVSWEESMSEQLSRMEQMARDRAAQMERAIRQQMLAGPKGIMLPDGSVQPVQNP